MMVMVLLVVLALFLHQSRNPNPPNHLLNPFLVQQVLASNFRNVRHTLEMTGMVMT